ncbi:MAG TPA: Gfo/Idh/MocA family oxidoreductase [Acetobacteraceae bacterium]
MTGWRPRVAIIGTGGIARVHVRLIRELGGELVAVCGRTQSAASAFGQAEAHDDPARMVRKLAPDIVHVCSPHHLHAAHSITALSGGAHVLCEKPMATSIDDAQRMIDAAEQAGRVGAVAYTYRGYPLIEVLRAKVAAGAFGRLRRAGGCYLSQDVLAADKYVWMFSPGTSGRSYALMDLGVHWLDLVEFVSGQRIVELSAQFSTHQPERVWRGAAGEGAEPPGFRVEDGGVRVRHALEEQADLLIRLDNGAAGSVTVSGVSPGHPNTIRLSFDGSERGADWDQQDPNVWVERSNVGNTVHQRAPEDLPPDLAWMSMLPAGHAEGYVDAFRNVVRQCWSAMRGDASGCPRFSDGLRGVRLIEAAVQSATSQRMVALTGL